MTDQAQHELIIVRRHEEEEHAHHSSAWKVAHADFMTAMMAFFLIMWLINVTDDEVRKGISQYFNPIHLSVGSTDMKGLNEPAPGMEKSGEKVGHADAPPPMINPLMLSEGNPDPIELSEAEKALVEHAAAAAAAKAAAEASGAEAAEAEGVAAGPDPAALALALATGAEAGDGADGRERAAFQDPYAVLAKLAAEYAANHAMTVDAIEGDDREPGVAGGEVDRDPFDPVYWQMSPLPAASADHPGSLASAEAVPADGLPDALAPDDPAADVMADDPETVPPEAALAALPESAPEPPVAMVAEPEIKPATVATSATLEAEIAKSVRETMAAEASPAITVKATAEGVLINLTDDATFSMFAVGSAVPDPKVVVLMERIAKVLAGEKGDVIVRGYTDGRPFHSDDYDNWRLSTARAHMAYYMLTRGGLGEQRVVAIEGHADRNLKNAADPYAAENRRIEILLKETGT